MTRTLRLTKIALIALTAAIGGVACSSSDPPDDTNTTGTGGAASTTTTSENGGNTSTTATAGTGGSSVANGGVSSVGGATGAEVGGATSAGGATSTGTSEYDPLCGMTIAGDEAKKGAACTPEDVQVCYRTCGPRSSGFKPETCTLNATTGLYAYAEPSNTCYYPASGDYSCFKVPSPLPDAATCGITTAPQSGMECTAPECTLCSLGGAYLDSSASSKVGYCVCQPPNVDGKRTWSCAGANIWPCPNANGSC